MAVPPDFVAGQVLTAAQMNAVGLWLVKTQTIGSGVASVTVTDAFSADYTNYRIILTGGAASASSYLALTLGATATGYYFGANGVRWDTGAATSVWGSNQAAFTNAFYGNSDTMNGTVDLFNPNAAKHTIFTQATLLNLTTGVGPLLGGGYLANTTAYTAFTLTTVTGGATMTGGTLYVYGYRD